MKYLKRYIENKISEALETSGVVVIEGPKFCGKSTTSKLFCKSSYILDTKEKIELVSSNPKSILVGENPRLIDEWQHVPDLWNCVRTEIDNRDEKFGQFIFTGSSTPANKEDIYHSGAGRIVKIAMRTMSLMETGESKGLISLTNLFNTKIENYYYPNDDYLLLDTAFYICRGGWPLSLVEDKKKALKITENYCSNIFEFENSKNGKFRNKKKQVFNLILKSYARNISTESRKQLMIDDINKNDDHHIDIETFDNYIDALQDLYIVKDIDAWNPNFRSKTSIITSPTRHFLDTSIAAYVLNISPDDLMNDPKTFGMFFEDFAVKELSVYADTLNGEIRHYRDSNGLECDAVLHLKDGRYGLIEIKLGGKSLIEDGISTLTNLKNKIIKDNKKEPSFLMILTACGDGYVTSEGINVVPINLLRD